MRYRLLLTISLLLLLFSGCIKNDQIACRSSMTFKCSFELNDEQGDQFSKLVNKVDLYIFDGSGLLVKHISEIKNPMPDVYSVAVNLPYGTYSAVLYGTVNGNNEVSVGEKQGNLTTALKAMKEGESRMSDMRLMLNSLTGETDKDLGVILHGMVSEVKVTSKAVTYNIPFTRDTHTMELSISGLESMMPPTRSQLPDVQVRLEGNNKAYLYDNTLDMELGKVIHTPYGQEYLNGILVSRLSVLRLFKEHPMTLKISSGGKDICILNLTAEIMKSPDYDTNEDMDREDKFEIDIKVTTAGDFTITVNGWETTESGEVIG